MRERAGMSPERLIRRSNRGVDYIIGQGYYNLVSFRSPSLTHNRSDKRERPRTQPCLALLGRFRFRCDLVLLLPRVYCCTRETLRQPYLDRLTTSEPALPPPREAAIRGKAGLSGPCCSSDFGEDLGLMPMDRLTRTLLHRTDRREATATIHVIGADRHNRVQLTRSPDIDLAPSWKPQ